MSRAEAKAGAGLALAVFGAIAFSGKAIIVKLAYRYGVDERIGPAITAQTGMVGPLSTILMGVLMLGEPFTAWIAAGTVLVIAGIFVFSRGAAPR